MQCSACNGPTRNGCSTFMGKRKVISPKVSSFHMDRNVKNLRCPIRSMQSTGPLELEKVGFVAVNYITCQPGYAERFECLFCSRAKMIDQMPGFLGMQVLRADGSDEPYLIVSYWAEKASFNAWVGSPEFVEGHKRGFEDIRAAKEKGEEPPMSSRFVTYSVVAR